MRCSDGSQIQRARPILRAAEVCTSIQTCQSALATWRPASRSRGSMLLQVRRRAHRQRPAAGHCSRARCSNWLRQRDTKIRQVAGTRQQVGQSERPAGSDWSIGGVALKSLNMYSNVAFVRHKIACCVARSHATFHRLHAHRSVGGYSPGKFSRRPRGAVLCVSRFKCGPERANSWPHCLTLS